MEVLLIRHGLTQGNLERRYNGITDDPLCEEGRRLLRALPADPSVRQVFVSALRRTHETAAILFPNAAQIAMEGLGEMNLGAFEGRSAQEMGDDPDYTEWVNGGCLGRCPGGEDIRSYADRVCRAFLEALGRAEDGRAVFVAHGGTAMAVMSRFAVPPKEYFEFQVKNGCGYRANWDGRALTDYRPIEGAGT